MLVKKIPQMSRMNAVRGIMDLSKKRKRGRVASHPLGIYLKISVTAAIRAAIPVRKAPIAFSSSTVLLNCFSFLLIFFTSFLVTI